MKHLVDEPLKRFSCVSQTEGHAQVLKHAKIVIMAVSGKPEGKTGIW